MLKALFRKDPVRSQAETLFAAVTEQARAPEFYAGAGVPDTPEGRFELLAVHMFLAVHRLRREAPASDRLVEALQEVFFRRLDHALREMGVGDLSVGRKIRAFAESFYGRYRAYEEGLASPPLLDAAIARNIFESHDAARGAPLADYVRAATEALAASPELARGMADLGRLSAPLTGPSR